MNTAALEKPATPRLSIWKVCFDKITFPTTLLALSFLGVYFAHDFDLSSEEVQKPFTHMHCPQCKDESPYDAKLVRLPCAICSCKESLVATVGSLKNQPERSFEGRLVCFLLVAVILVQLLIFLFIHRVRVLRRASLQEFLRHLVCSCPFCNRRFKYPSVSAGTCYTCNLCKTAFLLPTANESE